VPQEGARRIKVRPRAAEKDANSDAWHLRERHHPRRPPPRRPAGLRPRRERDYRDARRPIPGVDYTFPFALIASIVPPGREEPGAERARVTLQSGEELQLERTGDLGEGNAGMLIFVDGR